MNAQTDSQRSFIQKEHISLYHATNKLEVSYFVIVQVFVQAKLYYEPNSIPHVIVVLLRIDIV